MANCKAKTFANEFDPFAAEWLANLYPRACRPPVVVGEQVVALDWLDGISADLEAEGYAVGSVIMGAHSVGAPHQRQRLYWCGFNPRYLGHAASAATGMDEREIRRLQYGASDWARESLHLCGDGKSRRLGPGIKPLAHGIPRGMGRSEPGLSRMVQRARTNRVQRLKGYGNAIVPQVAAAFLCAVREVIDA